MSAPAEVGAGRPDDQSDDQVVRAPDTPRLRWPTRLLAVGGGATVALSLPPWGFWPLGVLGVALFEIALADDRGRGERARLGWLFGAGWMFLGMGWMIQLTIPGYLAAGVVFAGYHAAAAAVAPTGRWRIVGRPAAHALAEALRFSFPFGGVPLASLGMSQVGGPLVAPARIGGVILLSWVVLQLGTAIGAVATACARRTSEPGAGTGTTGGRTTGTAGAGRPARVREDQRGLGLAAVAAGVAVVIVVAAATVAPRGSDRGEEIRIAAVQGGGEQGTSADDVPSIEVTRRHLATTSTISPDPDLDLVVWPENTIDVAVFDGSTVYDAIVAEAQRLEVPITVGVTEDAVARRFTNAQVVVTPDGDIASRYDKVRRVPFGEYVPFRSFVGLFSARIDRIGDAVAGSTPAVLEVPVDSLGRDVKVATVISWEVFFGGRAREGVEVGGEVIVNPTNGASYTGTIVQTQQVASSRLRAIETGRWVIQAAPTGFTAVVADDGEVVERTAQRERRVIVADVPLRTGETWYVGLGDGPWIVALLVVLGVAIWRSRPALPHRLRRLVDPSGVTTRAGG